MRRYVKQTGSIQRSGQPTRASGSANTTFWPGLDPRRAFGQRHVNPHLNAEHIAAPTRLRREYSSSNSEPSTHGIKLKSGNVRHAAVILRQAEIAPTVLERLARPNAAQWGTDIRRRNRKRPTVRRRFFALLRRRFACWRLSHVQLHRR